MAAGDLALTLLIGANDMASSVIRGIGASFGPLGVGMAALSVAALGIGAASVKMAGDYQQSMDSVQALNGVSTDQMNQYDASLKNLAIDAGVAPEKLTAGLNTVLGASYTGKQAMDVLTLATEDAKIGLTDAATTTQALTTVLKGFSEPVKDATRVNGEMIQTVTLGKMTMEQYAGSIGKAAVTSMRFHVSMEDMNATIATLTSNGIPSAAQAVTDYNQAITVMDGNIGTVSKSLNKNGIAFNETAFNTLDYAGKIHMLNTALQEASAKHIRVTGVTQQAATAIQVVSQHTKEFAKDLAQLSNRQQDIQATTRAWNTTQGGFNQTMSRANAAVQVMMIDIGSKLLPVLTETASSLVPLISRFSDWLIKSGVLNTIAQGLANGITGLITVISRMVSIGTGIVSFFQQSSIAATAVKIVLIALAGAALGFAASAVPALVLGFIAWATAAGAAALATLAAVWPFMLIGAAIALLIVGIILLVTHWSQVVSFLQGMWSAFASWFGGIMSAIGSFFRTVWTAIATFFEGIWNRIIGFLQAAWNVIVNIVKVAAMVLLAVIIGPLGLLVIFIIQHWTQIQAFLASVWNGIVSLAKTVWNAIVSAIATAIQTVVGWFVWLFNHNYYFHDLVVGIMIVFTTVRNFLINLWTTVSAWLANAWNTIKNTAITLWTAVTTAIHVALTTAWNWIVSVWTTVTAWLGSAWNRIKAGAIFVWTAITSSIHSALTTAWNWIVSVWTMAVAFLLGIWNRITGQVSSAWAKISAIFGSAWSTYIAGPLGGLWNSFTGWFNNLISQVGQWGANALQGFIDGLMSKIGDLKGALGGIMSTIGGWLGFHSPTKYGEGQYIVLWGQNMVKGFVAGMQQAQPLLNAQVNHMISAPNTIGYAGGGGNAGAGNAFALSGGNTHTIIVQMHPSDVYLDNKKVGESVMKYANRQVHATGAYRNG